MARRAQVDRVVEITRAAVVEIDAGTRVVVTRHGLVLVDRLERWTWYRLVIGGQWWSLTVSAKRDERQAAREAGRLARAVLERLKHQREAERQPTRPAATRT